MALRRYFGVVAEHRRRLLGIVVAAALIGQLVSYSLPARYDAVSTIQVISDKDDPQLVVEMVRGRDVAEFVVADLSLDRPSAMSDGVPGAVWKAASDAWAFATYGYVAQADGHSAAVDRVARALDAATVGSGRFVKITASAGSAVLASQMANAAARAVAAISAGTARAAAGEQVKFLQTQTDDAKKSADTARRQVLDYATRSNAIQSASVLAAASELEKARAAQRQNDLELIDARQRLAEVEADLRATPQQTVTTTTGDSSSRTSTFSQNPVYVSLRDRASARRQDVSALEARASRLDADTQARESSFRTLLGSDSELSALNQDLTLANQSYTQLARDLAVARSEAARAFTVTREIDHAVPPGYPAFPVRIQFAIFAALAAVLVSLAFLLVRYGTDSALRSPAEAEAAFADLRLLAVLPRSGSSARVGGRR